MEFKELLTKKEISAYALAKEAGVPYSCVADLCTGKTATKNLSLEKACAIAKVLKIEPTELLALSHKDNVPFRYFRSNTLHELKRVGDNKFVSEVIRKRDIDYWNKNGELAKALYLLALIDHLCLVNGKPVYDKRFNALRRKKLDNPFFVGGKSNMFPSITEAEKAMGRIAMPDFAKYNIIEVDVRDVA